MESGPGARKRSPTGLGGAVRLLSLPLLAQFVKFGIVGASNTLLAFLIYTLLLKVFGVWYLAAAAIGFLVGAVNSFLLNRSWTFRGHVGDAYTPVRWAVVQGCGLALNEGQLFLFVKGAGREEFFGQPMATVIVTVATSSATRARTFRVHLPMPPTEGKR